MQCHVYRSSVKDGLYVYVPANTLVEDLPEPVQKQLGSPELALSFELTADRSLGQEDPAEVLRNLDTQGFHIQMPRDLETSIEQMLSDRKE